MTHATFATSGGPGAPGTIAGLDAYVPGRCNIGAAEIASRRRTGYVGTVVTIGLLIALVALDAPPLARLIIALPAAIAASGYIQARLRFCAGYGSLGVYNFNEALGETAHVDDADARRRDRARALQISLASGLVGLAVGVVAVLLPV